MRLAAFDPGYSQGYQGDHYLMKITFPHMGTAYIPFRALLTGLGHEVIVPPPCTQRTLSLGTRYAPESACLPLKINIGNFLEAQEQGAEAVVMAGGSGPCRFGLYGQVQREILRDLGVEMEMIILEPPRTHWRELVDKLSYLARGKDWRQILSALRLAWAKFRACDLLEQESLSIRPYELKKGATTRALQAALAEVDAACDVPQTRQALQRGRKRLHQIPCDLHRPVLHVGIVGEIYTVLEPFVNLRVEERLGEMGVVVHRFIWLSHWIIEHVVLSSLHLKRDTHLRRWARPYLHHFVGGHGLESVAHTVQLAAQKVDGVIHLLPFTCMPEIVAQSILPQVSRDYDLPILTLVLDEHSGEAGIITRLEAFTDLLRGRRWSGNISRVLVSEG